MLWTSCGAEGADGQGKTGVGFIDSRLLDGGGGCALMTRLDGGVGDGVGRTALRPDAARAIVASGFAVGEPGSREGSAAIRNDNLLSRLHRWC